MGGGAHTHTHKSGQPRSKRAKRKGERKYTHKEREKAANMKYRIVNTAEIDEFNMKYNFPQMVLVQSARGYE